MSDYENHFLYRLKSDGTYVKVANTIQHGAWFPKGTGKAKPIHRGDIYACTPEHIFYLPPECASIINENGIDRLHVTSPRTLGCLVYLVVGLVPLLMFLL